MIVHSALRKKTNVIFVISLFTIINICMATKPSHVVYFVTEGKETGKGIWQKIGAAWVHEDGKGLALDLELLPLKSNGRIVVREPVAETEKGAEEGLAE